MWKRGVGVAIIAASLSLASAPVAAQPESSAPAQLQPSTVGANASTTVLITGSGFAASDTVRISSCPDTNPGAVYPVPFPSPGPGQSAGSVEFIDSGHVLLTTPSVIPAGVCDVSIGDTTTPDALTFAAAPQWLTVEIANLSDRSDSDVWISVGYNCPLSTPSPPYPPGVGGCNIDGRSNPDYAWPATASGANARRYWYEVYRAKTPVPAFTGVRLSDLPAIADRPHSYALSVANIDSGVVYVSYGEPVDTGASIIGRAPSYLTSKTRFDVFEITFHGSGTSAGAAGVGTWTTQVYANITAVSGLGILMDMAGYDNSYAVNGPSPRLIGSGIHLASGLGIHDVYRSLQQAGVDVMDQRVVVTADGAAPTADNFLRFVSPSTNEGAGYAELDYYLDWLEAQRQPMTVVGLYTGAGAGQGTWFCYRTDRFHADSATILHGTYGYPSQAAATAAAMHQCTGGTAGLDIVTATTPTSGQAGPVSSQAVYMQDNRYLQGGTLAAGNDLYNAIYRDFIVSFAYGFWGSLAGDRGWITTSWRDGEAPAFAAAWPGLADAATHPRWDAYAGAVWSMGNSYGMPYSDTFDNAGKGNPLVSGSSITTLRVTLRPDGAWGDSPSIVPRHQRVTAHRGMRFATATLIPLDLGDSVRYSIKPGLPGSRTHARDGIWFVRSRGIIKGRPTRLLAPTTFTITAHGLGEQITATVRLRVRR